MAARYLPGTAQVDVGGDWFDALRAARRQARPGRRRRRREGRARCREHGAAAQRAPRVLGRAPEAAVRARATRPPRERRARHVVRDGRVRVVDPDSGVAPSSSAGHPPPVVAYPDGRVELLEEGRGLPLGTGLGPKYRQSVVDAAGGSVVVLYSDGLVERRGRSIDEGSTSLVAADRRGAPTTPNGSSSTSSSIVVGGRACGRHRDPRRASPSGRAAAARPEGAEPTRTRCTSSAMRYARGSRERSSSASRGGGPRARRLGGVRERDRARCDPFEDASASRARGRLRRARVRRRHRPLRPVALGPEVVGSGCSSIEHLSPRVDITTSGRDDRALEKALSEGDDASARGARSAAG